ncbi:MLX-interacting protein isoform X1 [Megalops cyprinoides]|uniref:MLX-interacting protein isoform X1 n=1 Tax=Megalops cyprinoides TaxID=118141 RepID=UPI0018647CF5|nr:MLX-interacting protein isoform X1 [Megalops cyprinoides]
MATRELRQYRRAAMNIKQEQDDDSDNEEPNLVLKKSDGRESQIIHSGHFMVSSPHIEHPPKKGYDFDTVNKQTCQTYHFGKTSTSHLSIDASLTKLFECMTLAYSGKLVSPKWKNFKGLKLLWRDKIRLNNAIWRAWYMQYVEKRDNPVCHFVTPLEGTMDSEDHRGPEAIATEGKYWKRRIEIVIREYHKWRTYFKKRLQKHKDDDLSSLLKGAEEQFSLFGEIFPDALRVSLCQDEEVAGRRVARKSRESPVPMEMDPIFDVDVLMSEFSDTLFSTLASHQAVAWPNPREIAHAGNADMIQPGLIPLQPNLDFMDNFEPLQDLFHALRQPVFASASPTASSIPPSPSSNSQTQASLLLPLTADPPSVSLDHRLITSPGPEPAPVPVPVPVVPAVANHSSGSAAVPTYGQHYLPQYSAPMAPMPGPVNANPAALPPIQASPAVPTPMPLPLQGQGPAAPPTLPRPQPALDPSLPPTVITHTASSTITPSEAATTFSHSSGFTLPRVPCKPAPQTQPPAPVVQTFALPKPIQPSGSGKKTRPVQRIVPANTISSPHLILTAPFPGHTSAVIVTPSPLKADVVPPTGVVITSSIGRAPGFHILPQTQTSPQLIIPKEETASSSNCKKQVPSPSTVRDGRCSGQGSPCGPEQVPSPQSPHNSCTGLAKNDPNQSRRVNHISAEQKRRFNINIGFKTLCSLVPTLKSQSNLKPISNAATLQKTVEYIGKLQQERLQMQEETKRLREEIEELNASINSCQEQLPATGVPITRHRFDHMRDKFDEYVRSRTLQNWKFWIFSIIIKPLFESFNGTVSTTSTEELCQTTLLWLDRHCALPVLRPMVLSTLRQLSTSTSILTDPTLLPEEATQAVASIHKRAGDS